MRKIAVKMRKYINRISVLVTVFAVLVTASFYNPASFASGKWSTSTVYARGAYSAFVPSKPENSIVGNVVFTVPGSGTAGTTVDFTSDVRTGTMSITISPYSPLIIGDKIVELDSSLWFSFGNTTGSFYITGYRVTCDYPISVNIIRNSNNMGYELEVTGGFSTSGNFTGVSFDIDFTTWNSASLICDASQGSFEFADNNSSDHLANIDSQTKDALDGYDSTQGNTAQSTLDNSLSQSEAKQDSLFTSASDTLSDFTLSDISTMPKVVNALSFVSSTMTSIYTALGGINGVGIVLSVGCSILFVSLAVGAYKFYSSHKD